jgi:outer membrane lipoprotein SlyB
MEAAKRTLHPLLTAAAVSVIVFSGVGVAAMTGLIPISKGSVKEEAPVAAATEAPAPAPSPVEKPVEKPVAKHVAKVHKPAAHVAYAETPALTPPPPPAMAPAPRVAEAPKPVVKPGLLGTVESVREVEQPGQANGIGAVGGGIAGAVFGHNIGEHNKLVTILGAAGGALLGNHIEKQARATKQWQLTVRLDDGATKTITSAAEPFWHPGDRVRLLDGKLQPV